MPRLWSTSLVPALALALAPALTQAQSPALAPAPTSAAPLVWAEPATVERVADSTSARALAAARPAALTARTAVEPAKAPKAPREATRTNTALMVTGLVAILIGAAVDDDAGTVLILGGAAVGLIGLYRWLQ